MSKLLYTDKYDSNKTIREFDTMITAQGGDGTLLTAINKFRHLDKPFYGYAAGTVNFLMNKGQPSEDATIIKTNLLKVEVSYGNTDWREGSYSTELVSGPITETFEAFSDINLGSFNGWITFDCTHKDNQIGTFKGSSLVVSTAQGSTGLNRNIGGTILALDSKRWSVTGIATNRFINSVIKPTKFKVDVESRESVSIAIDGTNHVLYNVQSITITKGSSVEVIVNDLEEFQRKRQ